MLYSIFNTHLAENIEFNYANRHLDQIVRYANEPSMIDKYIYRLEIYIHGMIGIEKMETALRLTYDQRRSSHKFYDKSGGDFP